MLAPGGTAAERTSYDQVVLTGRLRATAQRINPDLLGVHRGDHAVVRVVLLLDQSTRCVPSALRVVVRSGPAERTPPRSTDATPTGPDVDLDREDIRLAHGTRLTNALADEVVDHVRRTIGRPSLSGKAAQSPQIAFRVPPSVRERAAVAALEGKTVSQLAREALEARLAASG